MTWSNYPKQMLRKRVEWEAIMARIPLGPWQYHRGEDYAVVMLPGENTEDSSIMVAGEHADELGKLITAAPKLLNAATAALNLLSTYNDNPSLAQAVERERVAKLLKHAVADALVGTDEDTKS